jgi:beta-galactosidase
LRWGAGVAAMSSPLTRCLLQAQPVRGAAGLRISLQDGWTVTQPGVAGASSLPVTLPHTAVKLSWQGWDPKAWQRLWTYRRSFSSPIKPGMKQRVVLHFEGVMSAAKVSLNGHDLGEHLGGFLPFEFEITNLLRDQNDLVVTVNGGQVDAPPTGGPNGAAQLDYLLPAGIHRDVTLRVLPEIYLEDVFAKPIDVLSPNRRVDIRCTIDAAEPGSGSLRVEARLLDGETVLSTASTTPRIDRAGHTEIYFTMAGLQNAGLWSPDDPKLYTLQVTLGNGTGVMHEYRTRIGFREARFAVDGFYLNGKKSRIFGLNRHELFPFTGFSMPESVMRRDAEMLRHELNCNMVRCSHYPQTEAFLDACDELGLMVWEEVPGWQYVGDDPWKELLLRDVKAMIVRDRNHPSVIIWGVRVNESANNVPLYTKTTALAKSLDNSRPTSGTMTHYSTEDWVEDVFAYDDYHQAPDGSVAMRPALPGVPFFFAEAVGQFAYEHGGGFKQYYRRTAARDLQEGQAKYHAQGHDRAANDPRCGGVIAWCAFDYASLLNGYKALKCPGVVDTFRIPKLGAAFYQSQVPPSMKPVIAPSFYWDFTEGPGPGKRALIFSNCESLSVTVGTRPAVMLEPDRKGFPNTLYPPFVVDLSTKQKNGEDLVVQGFVGGSAVLTRKFSSDRTKDKLVLQSDGASIANDGSDATRVWFAVCDEYGAMMQHLEGAVQVTVAGGGELVGDSSFPLAETGGVGAVWVRSKPGGMVPIQVSAQHARFGQQSVSVHTRPAA